MELYDDLGTDRRNVAEIMSTPLGHHKNMYKE